MFMRDPEILDTFLHKIDGILMDHGRVGIAENHLYTEGEMDGSIFPSLLASLWVPYAQSDPRATFNARINRHFNDQSSAAWVNINRHIPLSPDPEKLPPHHTASLTYVITEQHATRGNSGLVQRTLSVGRSVILLGQKTDISSGPKLTGTELEIVGHLLTQKVTYT